MKKIAQQYYAIIGDKVCSNTYSKIWTALQRKLGVSYLDLKMEQFDKQKRRELLSFVPKHIKKGKQSILSIQLTNSRIKELREVLTESGLSVIKLIRIPANMKEQELAIPSHIMRDLF